MDNRQCSAPDCDRPRRSSGSNHYCEMHYTRLRRTGTLDAPPRRTACAVEGCDNTDTRLDDGLCRTHRHKLAKYGSVHHTYRPADHARFTGDEASYSAMHQRVKKHRGSARTHSCADCGSPARQWSYDRQDPAERMGLNGDGLGPYPYSLDVSHYVPRCVSCHKHFDLRAAG